MFVYRVQDDEGRGPYRPDCPRYGVVVGFSGMWQEPGHAGRNPDIFRDFGIANLGLKSRVPGIRSSDFAGCGFRTVAQARYWFSEKEWRSLSHFGYKFVRMKTARVLYESDRQLIFTRYVALKFAATEMGPLYP